jgi:serine/threonine protein kinase
MADDGEPEADIGELVVGQKVGPYRLLFRLGKGGMGEVWAAQATGGHGFAKLVALKLLTGAEADSNSATMFFDEAKAAAALGHPAIVNTTDLGQYQRYFYLAMDMVTGPSLTALLQKLAISKQPMPPSMVIHVGNKIASALAPKPNATWAIGCPPPSSARTPTVPSSAHAAKLKPLAIVAPDERRRPRSDRTTTNAYADKSATSRAAWIQ